MMKSKPLIIVATIVATIVAAIVGMWVGLNIFSSGIAQILGLVGVVLIGYLVYDGLRRNHTVERLGNVERARILNETPAGARVLVFREGFMAKLSGFDILVDGASYAQLKSPQSVAIDLEPGSHQLVVKVAGKDQPPVALSIGPGEIVVVRIGMGIAGCEISQPSYQQARSTLDNILMIRADNAPGGPRMTAAINYS